MNPIWFALYFVFKLARDNGVIVVLSDDGDRKSTRLNSSHSQISYAVFCLKKQNLVVLVGQPAVGQQLATGLASLTLFAPDPRCPQDRGHDPAFDAGVHTDQHACNATHVL